METVSKKEELESVVSCPMDVYMRLEWHMQKLRIALIRLADQKAQDRSEPQTRAHLHEAFMETVTDPKLRNLLGLDNPPSW